MSKRSMDEMREELPEKRTRTKKLTKTQRAVAYAFEESSLARWENLTPQWQRYLTSFARYCVEHSNELKEAGL